MINEQNERITDEQNEKIKGLYKILLGLNAYGSLDLDDLKIVENYLKGSFDIDLENL